MAHEPVVKSRHLARTAHTIGTIDAPKLPGKFVGKVARILAALRRESELFQQTSQDVTREYAEKDAHGNLVTDDEGNVKLDPERAQEYHIKVRQMGDDDVRFPGLPSLDEELLDKQPLTVMQYEALLPFVIAPVLVDEGDD